MGPGMEDALPKGSSVKPRGKLEEARLCQSYLAACGAAARTAGSRAGNNVFLMPGPRLAQQRASQAEPETRHTPAPEQREGGGRRMLQNLATDPDVGSEEATGAHSVTPGSRPRGPAEWCSHPNT